MTGGTRRPREEGTLDSSTEWPRDSGRSTWPGWGLRERGRGRGGACAGLKSPAAKASPSPAGRPSAVMPRSLLLPLLSVLLLLLLPLEAPRAARASPLQASSKATCKVGPATWGGGPARGPHGPQGRAPQKSAPRGRDWPGPGRSPRPAGVGRAARPSPEHLSTACGIPRAGSGGGVRWFPRRPAEPLARLHPRAILVAYCVRSSRGGRPACL